MLPDFGELLISYLSKDGAPIFNKRQPEDFLIDASVA